MPLLDPALSNTQQQDEEGVLVKIPGVFTCTPGHIDLVIHRILTPPPPGEVY